MRICDSTETKRGTYIVMAYFRGASLLNCTMRSVCMRRSATFQRYSLVRLYGCVVSTFDNNGRSLPHVSLLEAKRSPLLCRQSSTTSTGGGSKHEEGRYDARMAFGVLGWGVGVTSLYLFWTRGRHDSKDVEKQSSLIGSTLFPHVTRAQCKDERGEDANRPSKRYNFLAEAVEIASPSVVFIERRQQVSTFFGEAMSVSSGSGFIVGDGTYVLTNAHVVGSSRKVEVRLKSGRKLTGEVTDIDQVADLALIKVSLPSNEKLPALKFGSSSELRAGEWVVALGSPLSLSNTTTAGIVSSVLRPSKELGINKPDMEYVQTDAPITIGNSGGPLVNLDGEVIGVNTMTAGPGISFAIPSDFASAFVENAVKIVHKKPKVTKYAIGVSMLSLSPGLLMDFRYRMPLPPEVTHGVFLAEVWKGGVASAAGLRRGDIILRIDGKDVYTSRDVVNKVHTGKRLVMEVVRGSRYFTVTLQPEPLS